MYNYRISEWICFFIIYCFIGWFGESIYVSFEYRKRVNRGFLNGPFLPIYGFGAIIMLFAAIPVRNNVLLIFLCGMIAATALEYLTGYVMEKLFHVKYWDYTYEPLNINGYICLGCSLVWGACSILLIRFIHGPVEHMVSLVDDTALLIFDIVFLIYFAWDVCVSAREAFDLKKIIIEQIKQNETIQRLQKRLDVLIAVIDDDVDKLQEKLANGKTGLQAKIADSKSELLDKISSGRAEWQAKKDDNRAEREAEIIRIKAEINEAKGRFNEKVAKYKKHAVNILRRNPGTVSKRYKLSFETIKDYLRKK